MSAEFESDGVRVSLNLPKQVWGDLSGFLSRVFGPLAEASDLLSEKIRFFRFKSALKTLQRAKELAENESLELKQVPLKFLVPFLEQCSLEEEDSELVEQWARLLVSASTDYGPHHPTFVDILSQITYNEALLLKHIWKRQKISNYNSLKAILDIYVQQESTSDDNAKISLDEFENRGFLIMAGSIGTNKDYPRGETSDQNIRSLLILERQNLVKIKAVMGDHIYKPGSVYVVNAFLTPLGFEFVSACEKIEAQ